jgi:hypothetical protein
MRKEINGVSYLVYEEGMKIDNPEESYFFENDLDYEGDVRCLNFYALKGVVIRGYQEVVGDQYVGGNQYVRGYQTVQGYQNVRGNQTVQGYQNVRGDQTVGGNQYVKGDQTVGGNQDVRGNQTVGGYQYVGGYQNVQGYQNVRGNQYVRYIKIWLFSKCPVLIDRDSDVVEIGCESKTIEQWKEFFATKQKINIDPSDRNYAKLEAAFYTAITFKEHMMPLMKPNNEKA